MVNIIGKLASFERFSVTVISATLISLATDHHSPVPRPRWAQRGQVLRKTLPRWVLPDTNR